VIMKDEPMFDEPPAPELKLSVHLRAHRLGKDEKVTYTAYRARTKREQCQECVWVLHEAGGVGWSINGATVARKDETDRLLLCSGHARLWKSRDGVGEKRKRAPRRRR